MDVHAAPDAHAKVVQLEARVGVRQVELHGQVVDLFHALDPLGRWRRNPSSSGELSLQHIDGKDDVVGVIGLAVAPLDALAQLERPHIKGVVGRHLGAQPGLDLAGLVVEHKERLDHGLVVTVVAAIAGQEGIPQLGDPPRVRRRCRK